ncbi:MAG: YbaB/EbfC family nucleoid-associated protein [bacterium]
MFDKLKQIKDLRDQAKALQDILAQETINHDVKDGKLSMVMDGNQKVLSLSIDPEYLTSEKKEDLEQGLKELMTETTEKAQQQVALKMRSSGMSLPGMG